MAAEVEDPTVITACMRSAADTQEEYDDAVGWVATVAIGPSAQWVFFLFFYVSCLATVLDLIVAPNDF